MQHLQTALEAAEEQSSQQTDRAERAEQLRQVTAGGVWSIGKLFLHCARQTVDLMPTLHNPSSTAVNTVLCTTRADN